MSQQVDEALDFVRRISAELRPGVLDKLGLIAALEWQSREIEMRSELAVQVEAEPIPDELPEIVAVTLFRIAQEALTNVMRHAHARVVEVRLAMSSDEIILEIRDDGAGITPEAAARSDALGIIGMQERAVLVNGWFTISGAPRQGTVIRVGVPISMKREDHDANSAGG
jgi:signal transduction histidine kinase